MQVANHFMAYYKYSTVSDPMNTKTEFSVEKSQSIFNVLSKVISNRFFSMCH